MIVTKADYSPSREERLDEYLCNLSNHIEVCVIGGGDPRKLMLKMAERIQTGQMEQVQMINRFRGK